MIKRIGIVQPLLLAATIAIGFATVWAVLMAWGVHMVEELFGTAKPAEYLNFRMDGTPVIETYQGANSENVTYRDLEGNALPISREEAWLGNSYLPDSKGYVEYDRLYPWLGGFRWNKEIMGYSDGGQPMSYWYLICDRNPLASSYFIGFDSVSKQGIGYIGRNGFRSTLPVAEDHFPLHEHKVSRSVVVSSQYGYLDREPVNGGSVMGLGRFSPRLVYVLAEDSMVEVDLLKRSTRVVLEEPGLLSACQLIRAQSTPTTIQSAAYLSQVEEYLAVRAKDRILILNRAGKLESSFKIPVEFRDARSFMFCLLSDNSAILDVPSADLLSETPQAVGEWQLLWIDGKGNILRRKDYSLQRGDFAGRLQFWPWNTALAIPAPPAMAAVSIVLAPQLLLALGEEPTYLSALGKSCRQFWPALLVVLLLSAALAVYCFRRQRRYYQPYSGAWFVFVLLTGLPGLVGYLFHRRWPVLENCPACGHAVPRDRETCAKCGAAFPQPAPKGCEVFAP
jgi:hypothetical protein